MKNKENNKEKDIRLFEQQVKELTDEQLDSVAGGAYTVCPPNCQFSALIGRCACEGQNN